MSDMEIQDGISDTSSVSYDEGDDIDMEDDSTKEQDLDFEKASPYPVQARVEYEVLAEKKRKDRALKDHQSLDTAITRGSRFEELMEELMPKRKKRKIHRKKGRRKGSKNKVSPMITKKLGEANMYFCQDRFDDAVRVLKEVIKDAPNLSEAYITLGLIYEEKKDMRRAVNFYMLAPNNDNASLWKRLFEFLKEEGKIGPAAVCLERAIRDDPIDLSLRFNLASFYAQHGDHLKSAKTLYRTVEASPGNVGACIMAARKYKECNKVEVSVEILEKYLANDKLEKTKSDYLGVVDELVAIHMENGEHIRALGLMSQAHSIYKDFNVGLAVKEVLCHVHVGNVEEAVVTFEESIKDNYGNASTMVQVAQCCLAIKERSQAIKSLYTAVEAMPENIDARIMLASIYVEERRDDEAIALLSPPEVISSKPDTQSKPWWVSWKVKMRLANIYNDKGMLEEFVRMIISLVQETLVLESARQKVKKPKKLSTSILSQRAKVLDGDEANYFVFPDFKTIAPSSEKLKARRAKKALQRKAVMREEEKTAVLAAGQVWHSDDSDDEPQSETPTESPLPRLLKDEEHYQIVLKLCNALVHLKRYPEAQDICEKFQGLVYKSLSTEKKDELRALTDQISIKRTVEQNPQSLSAWNCYYGVISRLGNKLPKDPKFLNKMRKIHPKCLPPMIIAGHQRTLNCQHQLAAVEYLKAHKLQPDNPLINLCAGTALINIALGLRVQNKNQCLVQGFSLLFKNLQLSKNSQEALYNIARAFHHVGLFTLAVSFYEKVLTTPEKDYPIPKLLNKDSSASEILKPVLCNLHREAAHNLHLIYRESGAVDLARQVLRDHCTL